MESMTLMAGSSSSVLVMNLALLDTAAIMLSRLKVAASRSHTGSP